MTKDDKGTPLGDALQEIHSIPFHMPGHKRNTGMLGGALPWRQDITEISGFDNLQNPTGLLLALRRRAAALWGSRTAFLGVNGSTGCLLAAVRAFTQHGDTALIARNCHMAVFHAAELRGLRVVLLEPEWLPAWGIYGAVRQQTLNAALAAHPAAALCVVTSPTYEGIHSPLECPIPLVIDAAHGAHLPLPAADLVVVSLHKTLPALTQTALLHVTSDRVNLQNLEHQFRIFQTSSPSYVLLASIEQCVALLKCRRAELFAAWQRRLDRFYACARQWRSLRLFAAPHDRSKLLIACPSAEATAAYLRQRNIEPEYAQGQNLLLLTSPCDTDEMMRRLFEALQDFSATGTQLALKNFARPACSATVAFQLRETGEREVVSANQAVGRLCAEYIWDYPPGIPLLLPGQAIAQAPPGRRAVAVFVE
jgi:arginine/lysine/ornithine decarboxylase